jgi:hypothetical protein
LLWPKATLGNPETSSVNGLRIAPFKEDMVHLSKEAWENVRAAKAIRLA